MNAQLTEIMRLITNLIRTGIVTKVDWKKWLCQVKVGELETAFALTAILHRLRIPWAAA